MNRDSQSTDASQPNVTASRPNRTELYCAQCGYNLRGLTTTGTCPECNFEISKSLDTTAHHGFRDASHLHQTLRRLGFVGALLAAIAVFQSTLPGHWLSQTGPVSAGYTHTLITHLLDPVVGLALLGALFIACRRLSEAVNGLQSSKQNPIWLATLVILGIQILLMTIYILIDLSILTSTPRSTMQYLLNTCFWMIWHEAPPFFLAMLAFVLWGILDDCAIIATRQSRPIWFRRLQLARWIATVSITACAALAIAWILLPFVNRGSAAIPQFLYRSESAVASIAAAGITAATAVLLAFIGTVRPVAVRSTVETAESTDFYRQLLRTTTAALAAASCPLCFALLLLGFTLFPPPIEPKTKLAEFLAPALAFGNLAGLLIAESLVFLRSRRLRSFDPGWNSSVRTMAAIRAGYLVALVFYLTLEGIGYRYPVNEGMIIMARAALALFLWLSWRLLTELWKKSAPIPNSRLGKMFIVTLLAYILLRYLDFAFRRAVGGELGLATKSGAILGYVDQTLSLLAELALAATFGSLAVAAFRARKAAHSNLLSLERGSMAEAHT